jgi:ribonucleoside-diphosphate reductase alpha chain
MLLDQEQLPVTTASAKTFQFAPSIIHHLIREACDGLAIPPIKERLAKDVIANLYTNVSTREVYQAIILSVRTRIEREPAFAFVAARLLLNPIYSEAVGEHMTFQQAAEVYDRCFTSYFDIGIRAER